MATNATISTTIDRLRSRSPAANLRDSVRHRGDEVEAEGEVDEVHRLDQADDQEHDHLQPALRLRLPRDARDRGVAGQAVADRGTDGASAQRETCTDQRPGDCDCVVHWGVLLALSVTPGPRGPGRSR